MLANASELSMTDRSVFVCFEKRLVVIQPAIRNFPIFGQLWSGPTLQIPFNTAGIELNTRSIQLHSNRFIYIAQFRIIVFL